MAEAADYWAREHLRDGRPVKIRALRPDDRADMLAAIGRTSMQSLQRRFFVPKKGLSRAGDDLSSSSQATQKSLSSWSMTIRLRALGRS